MSEHSRNEKVAAGLAGTNPNGDRWDDSDVIAWVAEEPESLQARKAVAS